MLLQNHLLLHVLLCAVCFATNTVNDMRQTVCSAGNCPARSDGTDFCEGREVGHCHDGYFEKEGACFPCRDNDKFLVYTAQEAAESFTWNTQSTRLDDFYGVLWSNASHGELFNLGACQAQYSWLSNFKCVLTEKADPNPEKISQYAIPLPFTDYAIELSYTVAQMDPSKTKLEGQSWVLGLIPLKPFGVHTDILISDKDSNKWQATRFPDRDVDGPYYKIIDAKGQKTDYWSLFEKTTENELYYRPRHLKQILPQKYVRILVAMFIVLLSTGLWWFRSHAAEPDHIVYSIQGAIDSNLSKFNPLWYYWPLLAILLIGGMGFDTYQQCGGERVCCKLPNDYTTGRAHSFEYIGYVVLYFLPIYFGLKMASRCTTWGCCWVKKKVELQTDGQPNGAAMRYVFIPLGFVMVLFHLNMFHSRYNLKENIGTPWRITVCTAAQVWTVGYIAYYFKGVVCEQRKLFFDFAKSLMFLMFVRFVFLYYDTDVESMYFAMNPECPNFNWTQLYAFAVLIGLISCMKILYDGFGTCCFKITLAIIAVLAILFYAALSPVNFCAGKDCAAVHAKHVGIPDSMIFTLFKTIAVTSISKGVPQSDVILVPSGNGTLPLYPIRQAWTGIKYAMYDEDEPNAYLKELGVKALFFIIRMGFPIKDREVEFSTKQKTVWRESVVKNEMCPNNNYTFYDTSEATISHIAFAGFSAQALAYVTDEDRRLAPSGVNSTFKVDYSILEGFEYRHGYAPYGSIAYFDTEAELQYIRYMGKNYVKGDEDWEFVKYAFRSTSLTFTTLIDHLVGAHMIKSGMKTIASRVYLNTNHPLRRFIKPFTHDSISVNFAASQSLFPAKAALARAVSFTPNGFHKAVYTSSDVINVEDARAKWVFCQKIQEITKHASFCEDMLEYVLAVKPYVEHFVDTYYKTDDVLKADEELVRFWTEIGQLGILEKENLTDYLTWFIFTVTAYHRHIGTVGDFIFSPDFASGKIRPGKAEASIQSMIQLYGIALGTGKPQVSFMNYRPDYMFLQDEFKQSQIASWEAMIQRLEVVEERINQRNKDRKFPCNTMKPSVQGISIAV